MRLSLIFFQGWQPQNFVTKNFMEDSYSLMAKITPDVSYSLLFLNDLQELGDSLRGVYRNLSEMKDGLFCENS